MKLQTFDPEVFETDIFDQCRSEAFRTCSNIIGEVPFFIAPYPVESSQDVAGTPKRLEVALAKQGIKTLTLSLYDLMIESLETRGLLDQIISNESDVDESELRELLNNVTDPNEHFLELLTDKIQSHDFQILFVTDSGMLHPFFRLHTLLNNMQSVAKGFPSIFFFPGNYVQTPNGSHLTLFGRLPPENYYRAYNIIERTARKNRVT